MHSSDLHSSILFTIYQRYSFTRDYYGYTISEGDYIEEHAAVPYTQIMLIHKVSVEKANRLFFQRHDTGPLRNRHTVRLSLTRRATLTFIRNTDPAWLRCLVFDAFPLNARRNILHDPESQSNTARRYLGCREKQNRDRSAWRGAISRLYRDGAMGDGIISVPRFLAFPAAATQSKSARVFSSRRGWQDSGIREESRGAKKERQEERQQKTKKKKERKKKGRRREEEIVHLSSCKVGKMDGTRNLPPVSLSSRLRFSRV